MKSVRMGLCLFAVLAGIFLVRGVAYADVSATIGALSPSAEVPVGAGVTFSLILSGFTNPTFYLVDSFAGGATSANINSAGDFSWTPNKDEAGSHALTITVSDSQGDTANVSQTITVDGTAGVSISSISPGSAVSPGVPVSFSVSSSGMLNPTFSVGDAFSYSSVQSQFLNASGVFNWTPVFQDIGTHVITVIAKDYYGNSASASTNIIVLPAPRVAIEGLTPGATVSVNQTLTFLASTTGFVGPVFAVSDANVNSFSTSTPSIDDLGEATWTPQFVDVGVHPLHVTVTDSGGRSDTASLTVTVVPASTVFLQTVTPYVPPTTTPAQTSAQSQTQTQTQPQTKTPPLVHTVSVSTAPANATEQPFIQTQTAPLFTDAPAPQASDISTATVSALPPLPPDLTFTQFVWNSTVNFFVSLFKFF